MTAFIREYVGQGEYLSPQAPDEAGAHDDACMMLALESLGANRTPVGDIVFLQLWEQEVMFLNFPILAHSRP